MATACWMTRRYASWSARFWPENIPGTSSWWAWTMRLEPWRLISWEASLLGWNGLGICFIFQAYFPLTARVRSGMLGENCWSVSDYVGIERTRSGERRLGRTGWTLAVRC